MVFIATIACRIFSRNNNRYWFSNSDGQIQHRSTRIVAVSCDVADRSVDCPCTIGRQLGRKTRNRFIHLAAFTSWLKMLPPQHLAEVVAEVRVELLISFLLMGLSGGVGVPLRLSSNARQFLGFAVPGMLTAICGPIVFMPDHQLDLSPANPYLLGSVVAIVLVLWTRSVLLSMLLSMGFFFFLRWWL